MGRLSRDLDGIDTAVDWQSWARKLVASLESELALLESEASDGDDALREVRELAERVKKLEDAAG